MEFPDGQLVIVSAQRVQEVIEVAGSNHAIGVILNLAWGPNNFSPSMIWNWRTYFSSYGLVPVGCCPFPFSFSKLDIIDIFLSFYVIIIIIIYFICYSVTSFSQFSISEFTRRQLEKSHQTLWLIKSQPTAYKDQTDRGLN